LTVKHFRLIGFAEVRHYSIRRGVHWKILGVLGPFGPVHNVDARMVISGFARKSSGAYLLFDLKVAP
jgi:hypothetical protein